jgi:uncharacterized protein YecE (DUF72 family)
MDFHIGTSGFSYKEWKGHFYPSDLPPSRMLGYYATRFNTVEINNTFYRMPRAEMLAKWRDTVPPGFRFVLKTPKRITHQKKLEDTAEEMTYLAEVSTELGEARGPFLVQIPPYLHADFALLERFLGGIPSDVSFALETRHASWNDPEVASMLASHGHTLCIAEVDGEEPLPFPANASWGYLRLRRTEYPDDDLRRWADRVRATGWQHAWIFFKHEDEGKGPRFASRMSELLAESS